MQIKLINKLKIKKLFKQLAISIIIFVQIKLSLF